MTSGTDSIRSGAFLRYFSGRTISSFGSSFGFLALTFAILAAGGSATDLGLVIGAGTLPISARTIFPDSGPETRTTATPDGRPPLDKA